MTKLTSLTAVAVVLVALAGQAQGAMVFSFGAGFAVSSADRAATFGSITSSGIDLSTYAEDGLSITVPDYSYVGFDPFSDGSSTAFHYGSGGNSSYVTIKGTDSALLSGLEFKLGDGYGGTTTNLLWEARLGGVSIGSGFAGSVAKGTIVGWSNVTGFDELRVAAGYYITSSSTLGDYQAIALDNVSAELFSDSINGVPEPTSLALLGLASLGGIGLRWRQRRQAKNADAAA